MPASEARIAANRLNAAKSTGPKSIEGKERARANSYQHGMTGAGVVVPADEAAEVERRVSAFQAELQPQGAVGLALVRRAAILAVRMEKCSERELTATAERVARAMAEFEAPAGVDAAEATRLRAEAGRVAAFDPSREACLARKYEAAAERGFYKALKEFRLLERAAKATGPAVVTEPIDDALGSFLPARPRVSAPMVTAPPNPVAPRDWIVSSPLIPSQGRVDVPFTIGRAR